jgi:hypothetical protein
MRKSKLLPQCEALTKHGVRCRMHVERLGFTLCNYHHPDLKAATVADNTAKIREYWAKRRAAKVAA